MEVFFLVGTSITEIFIGEDRCLGITVNLPKTMLMTIVVPEVGYIMCGVLNVSAMDLLHADREIIAGRVIRVKDFDDMLQAEIESITNKGQEIGISPGMKGEKALKKMIDYKKANQS